MLSKILPSCQYVSSVSKHVRINFDKVDETAKGLRVSGNNHWLASSPFGLLNFNVDKIVNFLLINHTIGGFSYWGEPKWTIQTESGELDGSFAMMHLLLKELRKDENYLNAERISNVSFEEFSELLKANVEIPLLKERYDNLITVGNVIERKMNGDFYAFIKNIYSDEELFNVLTTYFFDVFNDVSKFKEREVYFYKLAQLTTSDILQIRKLKERKDVDYTHLAGCPDYKIPQVLRMLGVLEYSKELSSLVDNKREIDKDSDFEIEIRANMIVAIDEISQRLNKVYPIEINDLIWLKGQNKSSKMKPYHLTRSRFY